jgi:hypothetical protein
MRTSGLLVAFRDACGCWEKPRQGSAFSRVVGSASRSPESAKSSASCSANYCRLTGYGGIGREARVRPRNGIGPAISYLAGPVPFYRRGWLGPGISRACPNGLLGCAAVPSSASPRVQHDGLVERAGRPRRSNICGARMSEGGAASSLTNAALDRQFL